MKVIDVIIAYKHQTKNMFLSSTRRSWNLINGVVGIGMCDEGFGLIKHCYVYCDERAQ